MTTNVSLHSTLLFPSSPPSANYLEAHIVRPSDPFQLLSHPWNLNIAQESENLQLLASGKPQRFQRLLCAGIKFRYASLYLLEVVDHPINYSKNFHLQLYIR